MSFLTRPLLSCSTITHTPAPLLLLSVSDSLALLLSLLLPYYSANVRIGYAGTDQPRACFPTAVGVEDVAPSRYACLYAVSAMLALCMQRTYMLPHLSTPSPPIPPSFLRLFSFAGSSSASKPYYRHDLDTPREHLAVHHPVQDGVISDWDAYESLWSHALANYIKADMRETPVLLSEKVSSCCRFIC